MNYEEVKKLGEIQRSADDALSVPVMINYREQDNIVINALLRRWRGCKDGDTDTKASLENVLITYYLSPSEFDVMVTGNLTAQEYRALPESPA